MRILILGGTTEASQLARLLADDNRFEATLSLAGRTVSPKPQALPTRIGGFGGIAGLQAWLQENGVEVMDLDSAECIAMLGDYIRSNPQIWNEDIGEE